MDVQSAVPAFLLLGSAAMTAGIKAYDVSGSNRMVVGSSVAILTAVATSILGQSGSITISNLVNDQALLAVLVTAVFLLTYYVCFCCCPSSNDNNIPIPDAVDTQAITPYINPTIEYTGTCCGGDPRDQMINTNCPDYVEPPEPYPPCIDNVYNENCYSKPFVPGEAVPCSNVDENMRVRWDKRIECAKHKEMVMTGDYPWDPSTPNWQNKKFTDENAKLWYGVDPGYAPARDSQRNIIGRYLPKENAFGYDFSNRNKKQATKKRNFSWVQPPPKPARFKAPIPGYIPNTPYVNPDSNANAATADNQGTADTLAVMPQTPSVYQGSSPVAFHQPQYPGLRHEGPRDNSSKNWVVVASCALGLLLQIGYRNMLNMAKDHKGGYGTRLTNPFKLGEENPSNLANAVQQDATLMGILLLIAFGMMAFTKAGKKNKLTKFGIKRLLSA